MENLSDDMVEKARAEFEKQFGKPIFRTWLFIGDFSRDSTGMYYSREARRGWEVWEMAWRSAVRDAVREIATMLEGWQVPETFRKFPSYTDSERGGDEMLRHVASALRKKFEVEG